MSARARLGELARHAAQLHDRQLRRIGQHDRHLQDHAERVADVVRMELGKAFGAVAALKQKRLALATLASSAVRSRASPANTSGGKLPSAFGRRERMRRRDRSAAGEHRASASYGVANFSSFACSLVRIERRHGANARRTQSIRRERT
jgi:hypothetical protein